MVITSEMKMKAEIIKVLGHPERIAILMLLSDGEKCVKELKEELGISQPKVSQHVGIMKELGILNFRKEGTKVLYSIGDDRVKKLLDIFINEEI
ncbi:ArsR/SmtB family transcription factor [Desulfurobacterium atlanticum]|uniref:ArsR family transcriptional regulator n=1 Tax=Desulfurobacterium atlanticum TaxID=240169 RepID=A0A238ZQU3_9BACT|nr:metalloregulator ArsR/SmtB family transcription factor [Desulfurobacterium atlanticum]SNR85816.1 ArsR family transcriptional regulator [Desulfurobacterium atlanticum]